MKKIVCKTEESVTDFHSGTYNCSSPDASYENLSNTDYLGRLTCRTEGQQWTGDAKVLRVCQSGKHPGFKECRILAELYPECVTNKLNSAY
ncbi:hypothetical protein RRG08_028288 [Elysia crispata]|uniref:Uncharacterized protein n=1 Tax=Elysia crispata TaxID=231223 RepID=A0AAE1AXJ2_9GAST|nr:hypothetical protein RRG08_028288 [Elysia crispata]